MNSRIAAYLPQDRLRALARGDTLPDRTVGAALIADLAGFTLLTENLRDTLGRRYGAEVLTKNLTAIYTALIAEVERYGGSVIGFAGDAILCWFDQNDENPAWASRLLQHASLRAVACALAMQTAMGSLDAITLPARTAALALKIGVASGPARRFVAGDPEIHSLDVLAGATLDRMASAERLAKGGETLLDAATVEVLRAQFGLDASLTLADWRQNPGSQSQFAVLNPGASLELTALLSAALAPMLRGLPASLPELPIPSASLRPWLHQPVFERELSAQGDFLAEFRPCVAMFIRFMGIDYDSPAAGPQLDDFLRRLQSVTLEYDGTLLSVAIGDKGSYAFVAFGALIAHEDDAIRAVKVACQVRELAGQLPYLQPVQIGLSRGVQYVGVYGGATRRTFSILGDDVNLAARLMEAAAPGETLLSGRVQYAVSQFATIKPRPPMAIKGKIGLTPVFAVAGLQTRRAIRLQEPTFSLPFVGRQDELQRIDEKLDQARQGQGQVLGLVAEAGLGKSRLLAELIRMARRKGFVGYGGACQSDGVDSPYLLWKPVWSAFFEVEAGLPPREVLTGLEEKIKQLAPQRLEVLPLVGQVLDLLVSLPQTASTEHLDPKTRKNLLHGLLEACLKTAAHTEPVLIVLEDLHWVDDLSRELLEYLAQAARALPVCLALAYRPSSMERLPALRLENLPYYTRIELTELSTRECARITTAKLAELYPQHDGSLPPGLIEILMARTQGNPFYLEELLDYLQDHGVDPYNRAMLERLTVSQEIELPDSLHTLILGRMDRLTESQKMILRVASIAGRMFRADWLPGCYPALGDLTQVKADLEALDKEGLTLRVSAPQNTSEPELIYTFKHTITHEVVYEGMPYAMRTQLHEQMAGYLETLTPPPASLLDLLTYHYGRSDNLSKKVEYLQRASAAACAAFANEVALDYYARLLPLLTAPAEKIALLLKWGAVLELIGQWERAETRYWGALTQAQNHGADELAARCRLALGKLARQRGNYEVALQWLEPARVGCTALNDRAGLCQVLVELGMVYQRQGEYALAREPLQAGLALAREAGDKLGAAQALNDLGMVAYRQSDYAAARALYAESLSLRRAMGDQPGIATLLNNLGLVASDLGDYLAAQELHAESLRLNRQIGDKQGVTRSLTCLGWVAQARGDYAEARALYAETLALCREMGNKTGIGNLLDHLAEVALALGDLAEARVLQEESLSLRREMGAKRNLGGSLNNLGAVALGQGDYAAARALFEESLTLCQEMDYKRYMAYALLGLGLVELSENTPNAREPILRSLRLRQEAGVPSEQTSSLVGVAGLALQAGQAVQAAQWLGAVDSALKVLKAAVEPDIVHFHAQTLAAVQAHLGAAEFQAAWAVGAAWSLDEAVRLALEKNPHDPAI